MAEPDRKAFVRRLYPVAQRYAAQTGIPAEVFVAIAAHESNFGNSGATFGIKGPGQSYATHEIVNGRRVDIDDSFRTYPNDEAAFQDFVGLVSQGRYAPAWQRLQQTGDWRGFLQGINRAGYATDPDWAGKIDRFTGSTIQPLLGAQGGPKTLMSVQEQSVGDQGDQDVFDMVVAAKGQWVDTAQIGATTRKQPKLDRYGEKVGDEDAPIQNPTYRYFFSDKTYLDARKREDGTFEVVNGGTALTSMAREQRVAGAPPKTITVGGRSYTWNAQTGEYDESPGVTQPSPKPTAAEKPLMVGGVPHRWVPNYPGDTEGHYEPVPITGDSMPDKGAKPGRIFTVGNRIFRENDDGTVTKVEDVAPYRSPEQTRADQIALQKAEQGLLPEALRIVQGHAQTIKQLQKMYEDKQIDFPQMNAYVAASRAQMEAALRGSTPFDEAKERRSAEEGRRSQGISLLNQRLSSGAGLASSLLSTAGHAYLKPGQELNLDLGGILDTLQGGPEVAPFAKGLLTGAQPGSQGPSGPVIGTTQSGVPVYDRGVSGMRGGLPPSGAALPAGL